MQSPFDSAHPIRASPSSQCASEKNRRSHMAESSRALVPTERTPPYLSFQKFYAFLKDIEKHHFPGSNFVPDEALKNRTDEERRLLLRALDFFHLLDAEMVMTAAMQVYLHSSELSQKMAMQQWIRTSYPPALFEAIAEKDGEGIYAAFPDHLSETVKNRCMAFLVRFAKAVDLDLSTIWIRNDPLGWISSQVSSWSNRTAMEDERRTLSSSWTETVLPLDWGRFCILKHNGPLSAEDIERLKKGLDILAE